LNTSPKIDNVDVKIIKTLLEEPRTSFTKIAKNCGLSTVSIRNRFNNLKRSGIINGAIMQVNPKSFGYNCIAFANIKSGPRDQAGVREFLNSQQIAIHEAQLTRRNSIVGFIVAKDTDDLSRIVKEIQRHTDVNSVSTLIWIDITNMDHPENLIVETSVKLPSSNMMKLKKIKRPIPTSEQTNIDLEANRKKISTSKQLDKIDIALIKLLSKNARLSFRSIARKIGISPNIVIKRYKELRKEILPFSSITVDLKKLGYMGTSIITMKVSSTHSVNETFSRILQVPNVIVAIKIFNYYDILTIVPFRALEDLDDLTEKLYKIPGVNEVNIKVERPYEKWPLNVITELILKKI
jgi:DNA-binding Lrp family transcriptional regulator